MTKLSKSKKVSNSETATQEALDNVEFSNPDSKNAKAERLRIKAEKRKNRPNKGKVDVKAQAALKYLETWKEDRPNWKFKKLVQRLLIENCLDKRIPDSHFPMLLDYFASMQGKSRETLLNMAEKHIDSNSEEKSSDKKFSKKRAKLIKKHLEE